MRTVSRVFGKIRSSIDHYFFEDRFNAHSMVLLRVGVGLILILQFFVLREDLSAMLQESGIIRQELIVNKQPAYYLASNNITRYMADHFQFAELKSLMILGIVYLSAALFLVIGLFTRFSALVLATLHLAFITSGETFIYGVDCFLGMLLFYIVLFPVNREFSVDKRLFRLKPVNYTPFVRILQLHLCIVYFVSGFGKAAGENWWNGICILKAVIRPGEGMLSLSPEIGSLQWLFVAIGISTVFIELLYPVFINIRKTRKLWLVLTCMMHLGIAFFLNLPLFAATMILFNLVAYSYPVKVTAASKAKDKAPAGAPLQIAAS